MQVVRWGFSSFCLIIYVLPYGAALTPSAVTCTVSIAILCNTVHLEGIGISS